MLFFRPRSLRSSFLLVVAAAYIVALGGATLVFKRGAEDIRDRYAARFASSESELEKNKIRSLVDRELALSRKQADDPTIRAWMQDETSPTLRAAADAQLASYRRFLQDGANFVALKGSGNYYVWPSAAEKVRKTTLSPSAPGDRWFYRTLQQEGDYSLNVDHNTLLGETRIWINVLVRDEAGRPIGLTGTGIDLTAFLQVLVSRKEPWVSTVIIDRDGVLQALEDRRITNYNATVSKDSEKISIYESIQDEKDRAALGEHLAQAAAGEERVPPIPLTLEGRNYLGSAGWMPELNWFSLVFVDVDRVVDPADFLPIGLAFLGSLLLVLAVVVVATERMVIRPIAALNRAAGVVAAGAYEISVPSDSVGEIGELSVSFNTMAAKVREYTTALETKVAERTAELTEANGRIMDSIRYARMIQDAAQPGREEIEAYLGEYLLIDRPRDVVGGDFPFFAPTQDGFVVGLADCTGHGVPGAMMAMMAGAHLRRVVTDGAEAGPAELLARLHVLVRETLGRGRTTEHFDNGLDLGLCRYRRGEDSLSFAGMGNSLFVHRDGRVEEISGNRGGLGYLSMPPRIDPGEHRVETAAGAFFYLATDGALDLPGGEKGFGFGRARLQAALEASQREEASRREAFLSNLLEDYAEGRAQRDDLTILGFRPRQGVST